VTHPNISGGIQERYKIERELGRGGMGAVYLASDLRLGRLVALKVLPPELSGDAGLRERFLRETRTAASFSHPNIVPVHAVEDDGRSLAFVMGFVEGESLASRVARAGPLDVRSTVRLLQDVAYALAYAHGRGVVHRDIKPDNIMIERATGRALVMDFGIARAMTPKNDAPGLTRIGEVVGTPEYMSPEQASGDNVDGRSDLYSLGLVALFAVTGRAPITGESTQQIIVKQLTEVLPPSALLRPDLPAPLAAAIDRCVAKEPAQRFASAEALVEEIDSARLTGPEIPLPIRLFAQEAATLGLILTFFVIISWLIVSSLSPRTDGVDAYLPVMLLSGVVITRIMQARSEAGRLAAAGFTAANVFDGLHAVLDERALVRSAVAADPTVRIRRKRTVLIALAQIPAAALLFWFALQRREQVGPNSYMIGWGGMTMVMSALALGGVSFVLLVRSPFRAPIGERLFRLVWLGPIGRWFIGSAMRMKGLASTGLKTAVAMARPTPRPPVTGSAALAARVPTAVPSAPSTSSPKELQERPAAPNASPPSDVAGRLDRIEQLLADLSKKLDR
jgi:hypothetical protein